MPCKSAKGAGNASDVGTSNSLKVEAVLVVFVAAFPEDYSDGPLVQLRTPQYTTSMDSN